MLSMWLSGSDNTKIWASIAATIAIAALGWWAQHRLHRRLPESHAHAPVRKLVLVVSSVVIAFVVTAVFSARLGQITVALGLLGAAMGIALQELITSIAGWLAILFAGFYQLGDRVQLGDIRGDVVQIGVLRTTIMEIGEWTHGDLYTGRIVRVANSFVFKEAVFNYTGNFPYIWDDAKVPIRYDSDAALARTILERVIAEIVADYTETARRSWSQFCKKFEVAETRLDPMVTLTATDNWLEFVVRYVVDYNVRRVIKDRFYTRLLQEIEATGGRVAIASTTFQVVAPSALEVNLRRPVPR